MKKSYRLLRVILYITVILLCFISVSDAADHAIILQYHHFGSNTPPSTSVTIKQFEMHLAYLSENEYNVWPLEKIITYLKEKKQLPDKCVAITIDDAYTSVYEEAYPRLMKYGFPFTVFVTTEGVEKKIKSYMTWEQMREMQNPGITFSAHSHTHDYLIRRLPGESENAWVDRVINDIQMSLDLLKERLGSDSRLFAYPYGEYNIELKQILLSLGLTGFGQQSGPIWQGSDFRALPRFPQAAHFAEPNQFITKVKSLPLPVIYAEPDNPVLPENGSEPVLQLKLAEGDYRPDSIACYSGGQGKINVRWVDKEERILEITPNKPLSKGRSRYNCTAPHNKQNRFYWYSHLWIRG